MKNKNKKILVIGESCRDVFVYCDALRLAPDTPIPVLDIRETKTNPGMAKNVERNIQAIYPHCAIITNPNWSKMTKTRYMHRSSNQAFIRVDANRRTGRANVRSIPLDKYDIIAISDYNKGFLSEDDIKYLCEHHNNVLMDTKKILGGWSEKAAFIKVNNYEYERSRPYLNSVIKKKLIVTKGDKGAIFRGKTYPVKRVEIKDVSGAGDSFFAALVVRYAETGDIEESISFANACASEVVQHRGVTVIKRPA